MHYLLLDILHLSGWHAINELEKATWNIFCLKTGAGYVNVLSLTVQKRHLYSTLNFQRLKEK